MSNLHEIFTSLHNGSQVCTCDTLLRQRYITTNEEYLINCHILFKYFELVFLQLQLVKISCKLLSKL